MSPVEGAASGTDREPPPQEFVPPFVATSSRQAGAALAAKRALDVTVAAGVLLGTSPIAALAIAAIKLTSPGPVLFLSTRVGRNGKPFTMYKFRSMVRDADPEVHRRFVVDSLRSRSEGQEHYKLVDDSRVTAVGRVLRRTSIDELPQLVNVLRGEMSLVGPRPDVPYSVEAYEPEQLRRFAVLPGMTGLWQVSGRSRVSLTDMLSLDLDYVDAWSLWLDLKILVRTVPSLVRRSSAR